MVQTALVKYLTDMEWAVALIGRRDFPRSTLATKYNLDKNLWNYKSHAVNRYVFLLYTLVYENRVLSCRVYFRGPFVLRLELLSAVESKAASCSLMPNLHTLLHRTHTHYAFPLHFQFAFARTLLATLLPAITLFRNLFKVKHAATQREI